MSGITLHLIDSRKRRTIEDVRSFVGEDDSGSFGIRPGHIRMMTVLVFGLARFRCAGAPWEYIAVPGAILNFRDNVLHLISRHYLTDTEYERISGQLLEELAAEEEQLRDIRMSFKHMEETLLKRMWELRRQGVSVT